MLKQSSTNTQAASPWKDLKIKPGKNQEKPNDSLISTTSNEHHFFVFECHLS
ncbi:hypothetical protein Hanom_Chr12g01104291 [Helianthus anomalus]